VVRRYDEPIEVRAAGGSVGEAGPPDAFIWRGRLYAVRAVLDHWQERRPWWRDALDPVEEARPDPAPVGLLATVRERRVWRVEASPGRLARPGVYDLGADGGQWLLLRVAD
jgi:hypothetical protein